MINQGKWVSSLPKINNKFKEEINQLDPNRWVDTIPKKNTYNSIKKYSLLAILFASGLLLVSALKNETRNLQKEIHNLQTSIYTLKYNLDHAILDNEVITSPENISQLAKEYLSTDFVSYKKSQIKQLNDGTENFNKLNKKISKKENKSLSTNIKLQVVKKIEEKKAEIKKVQEIYSRPESIPREVKTQIAKKIKEKKSKLKNIYSSPKDIISIEKAPRWAIIQIVKAFLGLPTIPGK